MRDPEDVFHLAIPVRDLDETHRFYIEQLGCKLARRYPDRITVDFFGDQLVCHLSEEWDRDPDLYPRHFGVTFRERDDFDRLVRLIHHRELPTLGDGVSVRFEGTAEQHRTVFLVDPSNNVIEFKHYDDPRLQY